MCHESYLEVVSVRYHRGMDRSFNGPAQLTLPRITDPVELNSYADGSRFLLVYNRGTDMKIVSLQWNGYKTHRSLFVEGTGALLPVADYVEGKLKSESLYLLAGSKS